MCAVGWNNRKRLNDIEMKTAAKGPYKKVSREGSVSVTYFLTKEKKMIVNQINLVH